QEGGDINEFFNDIKAQVEAISSFPDKVEKPTVMKLERTATVASIAISGDLSAPDLKAYAEKVKQRLKLDRRIAQVTVKGFSDQDVVIQVPVEALQRYGVSLADLRAAIEKQSLDLPAGILQTDSDELIVRFNEQRRKPAEFADLIVFSSASGGNIRLGDIAAIDTRFDRAEEKIIFNGQRAALLEISKTYDQDSLRVMAAIKENLVRERQIAPKGITLEISADVTSNIRDRLRILISNGAQGLILVFLVMWLFFSFRLSFWVAMGLPVSFLGAIFVMNALGFTLNMMTMVGLLVAIGLLMDDAIVIAENVARKSRQGKSALAAAIEGTRQVLPGVLSSFVTTILIIGPLAFMSGKMGAVLKYIPAVLVITLVISLLEAFLILPAHLRHSLRRSPGQSTQPVKDAQQPQRSGFQRGFEKQFLRLRDNFFTPQIATVIRYPYLSLGILAALVMISYAAIPAGKLKYQAFPNLESDVIQARILLPQGTPLERTEEAVAQVLAALHQLDDEFSALQAGGKRLVTHITVLYNSNIDAYESGPHLATVSADLLRAEQREGTIAHMLGRWRELSGTIPDAIALKFTDKERGVAGKAIDLVLQGNRLEQLKAAAMDLQAFLGQFRGVRDLSDDLRPGKRELRIHLKESAGSFGLTAITVATEIRAALHGGTAMEVMLNAEAYDVTLRLDNNDLNSIDALRYLKIRAADGSLIPLSAVATIEETRGFARINRINGQRSITVQGTLDTDVANAREIMGMVKKAFVPELKKKYPEIRLSSQGQDKDTSNTGNSLQTNVLIGLLGIYLILTFQFRNYLQPFAVMLAIPMGFIGVVWGHIALGLDLTMPSLVGFATLAGIVVNDNILLVTFVKERLKDGAAVT
ncbi:MAG: efflux RND transporter permease subunit, partial [Candidatus Competibacteraceae bacterium]|nr:efflux RND transporter permease subunit [Candidatus Competibacteraceae bacterium]